MGCLLTQVDGYLIMDIVLVVIEISIELWMFEIFLHAAFCALIVDSKIERTAIGIEKSTDLLQNLVGLHA